MANRVKESPGSDVQKKLSMLKTNFEVGINSHPLFKYYISILGGRGAAAFADTDDASVGGSEIQENMLM